MSVHDVLAHSYGFTMCSAVYGDLPHPLPAAALLSLLPLSHSLLASSSHPPLSALACVLPLSPPTPRSFPSHLSPSLRSPFLPLLLPLMLFRAPFRLTLPPCPYPSIPILLSVSVSNLVLLPHQCSCSTFFNVWEEDINTISFCKLIFTWGSVHFLLFLRYLLYLLLLLLPPPSPIRLY